MGIISQNRITNHLKMYHQYENWELVRESMTISKEPMSNYKASFCTPGTAVQDEKKCPQGASNVPRHINSINHRPTPFGKLEEFSFNKNGNSIVQQYLDLAFKIARGEKGFDKYSLIALAEQHVQQLEQISKDYKLAEEKR